MHYNRDDHRVARLEHQPPIEVETVRLRKPILLASALASGALASTPTLAASRRVPTSEIPPVQGAIRPTLATDTSKRPARALEVVLPELLAHIPPDVGIHSGRRSGPCLTPVLVDLYRHRHALAPEVREALEASAVGAARPPSAGSVASAVYPLRVHYPSEAYQTRATEVLELAELSWQAEVTELGFSEPLPDGELGGDDALDIYLASYDLTGGGAYTQPSFWDADPSDDVQSCSSYVILYQDLDASVLPVYVAHEFNHTTQCAMDFQEFTWAWETTATFIEDVVFDDINDYYRYVPYFQAYPEQTLVYFDTLPPYALYPYGATIFVRFLDQALSVGDGRVASRLWIDSEQPGIENEPDFLDAATKLADEQGWRGLDDVYGTFALWRYLVSSNDDGQHFEEGGAWNATASGQGSIPPVRLELATSDIPDPGVQGDLNDVCALGTSYVLIHVDRADRAIDLTAETDADTRLGISATRIFEGAPSEDVVLTPDSPGPSVRATFNLGSAERVLVAFMNLATSDFDPDTWEADPAPCADIHFTLKLEKTGGCSGCDQGRNPRDPIPFALVLLAAGRIAARRRQRGGSS